MAMMIKGVFVAAFVVWSGVAAVAQVMEGEVRVTVRDGSGLPVPAAVRIEGRSPRFEAGSRADADGSARLVRLPIGVYTLTVSQEGFGDYVETLEIRSAVPQDFEVTLGVETVQTAITVTSAPPLLDRAQASPVMQVSRLQLVESLGTTMGRNVADAVTLLPGWLFEANAVLHPRGSEYDTQYVVDGMPVYDNRSIGFAPAFDVSEFEAVNVMTSGMPAEYGRRMGGVIALDTRRVGQPGHSTELDLQIGSFANRTASLRHQFRTDRTSVSVGGLGGYTDRYLDPPSLENFTNKATSGGINFRIDQDLTDLDRLSFYLRSNRTRFLVPNDLAQQEAGQRQDRSSAETETQVRYRRVVAPNKLAEAGFMFRDLDARLWSNLDATPVWVEQDRGFKETAFVASLTVEAEGQTVKVGGDLRLSDIRESFRAAEPAELPDLDVDFDGSDRSAEMSLFVQDHIRIGNFSANLGVRYDRYDLLIRDEAVSPRIGLAWYLPGLDTLLRASYDRVFQPPPLENLLLSSAATGLGLDEVEDAIAVPANRGNFFEVGLSRPFFGALRVDVSHYWRTFRNYIDDDVFLNTGLSFPITFDTARITGTEVRIDMPRWRWFTSSASYSNMIGWATSPVTGGLFIEGGEAEELRDVFERFPVSQDQRNTVGALLRVEPHDRVWFSTGLRYGSGLPVELEDDDDDEEEEEEEEEEQEISPEILAKVNFERGRVLPNFSLDFSVGTRIWENEERSVILQFDVRNATGRLNVINFTGAFSGTALAPGRQFTIQARTQF
jgi:outer membrane receptor protein involved in Fe transport